MGRNAPRVTDLAEEAGLDIDEALILLWEAGLDRYEHAHAPILKRELDRSRQAVGLAGVQQFGQKEYWQGLLGLDEASFDEVLATLAIRLTPRARRLPRLSLIHI